MPSLGPWELAIILIIVIVIFGAGRLSEIGSALGKGIREFRTAAKAGEEGEEVHEAAANSKSSDNKPSKKPAAETADESK